MTVNALSTLLQSLDRAVSKAQTAVVQLQQAAQQAQVAQQKIGAASGSSGSSSTGSQGGQKFAPNTGVGYDIIAYDGTIVESNVKANNVNSRVDY